MTFDAKFYESLAEHIATEIRPRTVLDVNGAAPLISRLQTRGITAAGLAAASEQAATTWATRLQALSEAYDLIVCLDVLEQIPAAETAPAIARLCLHTGDLLFSSTPFDFKAIEHCNVQPPDYWAVQFAAQGFFHDVDYDASYIAAWARRFRRGRAEAIGPVVAAYERRLWRLTQETMARRELNLEQGHELARRADMIELMQAKADRYDEVVHALEGQYARWEQLEASLGGRLLRGLQNFRARLAPPHSLRDQLLENFAQRVVLRRRPASGPLERQISIEAVSECPPLLPHMASADVIVCVHNALDEVQRCLESVVQNTAAPYQLILVDDGSAAPTRDFVRRFAAEHSATLLRSETARGYTFAAIDGQRQSTADYVVMLNSDTVVTAGWLDRMIACAETNSRIGLVGPLSNAATFQSIPEVEAGGDWALNPLPPEMSIAQMGEAVAQVASGAYPDMPFLNGFCLLIRRAVIEQIGYFDEVNFGTGYGEENDYCLRARAAGWQLSLADDTYVYHAQGRSYTDERRRQLSDRANDALLKKHGLPIVQAGVDYLRNDRVLRGIRAHGRMLFEQQQVLRQGRAQFAGKRVLWLLPLRDSGGGGSVAVMKARLMQRMGLHVETFNLSENRVRFERGYPNFDLPITFGAAEDVTDFAAQFDAVIATAYLSASWLVPVAARHPEVKLGYFIQDFEPYFFPPDAKGYQEAWQSYTLIPGMIRFATTEWIRQEVVRNTGATCSLCGPCFDANLFRPRPRLQPAAPGQPVRIAAMVRPESKHRAPRLTMEVLRDIAQHYGDRVEIILFGTTQDDPGFAQLPRDFNWKLAGKLNQAQMARLLNEVDIFADFSSYQALGITAQEAMASGAAVIVPQQGGASAYARDGGNCLVINSSSRRACHKAVSRLVDDEALRTRLQAQGLADACAFYPEKPTYNILTALFGTPQAGAA
jgi:GT2 family glycosyltransferase/glycosyltransferase involved in cell wall biosynthesis